MIRKAVSGIMLTLLLIGMLTLLLMAVSTVVVSPMSVLGVVDFEGESMDLVTQSSVDWWPMFHHDLCHSGYSTSKAPDKCAMVWRHEIGNVTWQPWDEERALACVSSPAVFNGKVFIGSADNKVHALEETAGKLKWSYATNGNVHSSPAVINGKVFFGSMDGKVYAVDELTGELVWEYETDGWVVSSPVVDDGVVFVGSGDSNVYALDESTGSLIWNYTTEGPIVSSPAIAYDQVFVGSDDDNIYALDIVTGTCIWNYSTGGNVTSSPAIFDGRLYIGSGDKKIYCLNVTTGAQIWNYTTNISVYSSPAVAYGKVFINSIDCLYALDATTGALNWSRGYRPYVFSSPAVANGKVFLPWWDVINFDVGLDALDAITGQSKWGFVPDFSWGPLIASPVVANGKLFVSFHGGTSTRVCAFAERVHNIDTGLDYVTIQEAINAPETLDGHTIEVDAGIYYENVVVNKSVAILGENKETTIIDGRGGGTIVCLWDINNVTFANFTLQNSDNCGFDCVGCHNCSLYGNIIHNVSDTGILLTECGDCMVSANDVNNNLGGIILDYCYNCTLRNNNMTRNEYNFGVWGEDLHHYFNDIDDSNTINGKPIHYLINKHDLKVNPSTFPSIGYLALVNSTNIVVQNLNMTHNLDGVKFAYTTNSTIESVIANDNYKGIHLWHSDNCTFKGNTVKNNINGISFIYSNDGLVYHNNFIDNTIQADIRESYNNTWDNGYLSGGNYWSDYTGEDNNSGPGQDQLGSDGIGDTPYIIDADNRDNYPLMHAPLDMIFVMDITGSMIPYMDAVKKNLTSIVDVLSLSYEAPLRFGVVGFKDYPHETVQHPLTDDYEAVKLFINSVIASVGLDIPESHYLGLQAAKSDFNSTSEITHDKVVVFISDAPAGKDDLPSFVEAKAEADEMLERGVKIHAVLCGPDETPENEQLQYYANVTGGQYIGPEGQNDIFNVVISSLGACMHANDLSVSSPDISFSDSNPSEGQTITISAKVHNLGERNLGNITVQFLDSNVSIGKQQISFISHNSQGTASVQWTAEGEGFHLIKVVIDPYNVIVETSEENNEATRSILVGEIPHFGGIVINGSVAPNETRTGSPVTVQGYAEYNTTYGAGEPVAGAEVTITIIGWEQETTHTIKDGTYKADITAPYAPGNYTIVVTVTDYTFWESIEIRLVVTQETGVDLTLSHHDISFSPHDPVENESVSITATIHNVGTNNANNVLVAFYDDNKPIGNRTIVLIPGGGSEVTQLTWNAKPWGWHTIKVVIAPENTTAELNENNNEASKDIYVYPPLPDLTPTNIAFSDNTPVVNQTITISANVRNIGGIEASNVLVSFYDDSQLIGNTTIPWIPGKGESRTALVNYAFVTAGSHTICVMVDPDDSTYEADEGNNWHCRSICVHLPSADLAISSSDVTFSNSTPKIGDVITIYATIHNIGEADAQNVTVELLADGVRINYTTIPFILAGGQETVDSSWNATPVGWRRIQIIIDGNNTILESNENNNVATRYIYVYPLPEEAADLCIYSEDIVFSNTNPVSGENVTIYATVHNIGEADAQNVTVIFYIDDIQLGSPKTTPSIPVEGEETMSTKWIATQIGSHVVKIIVDTPIESNKSNNVATRAIIVSKHDVAVTNVTVCCGATILHGGVTACINVTVTNEGTFTETFNVTAYWNTTAIQTIQFTLPSGASNSTCFSWNTTGLTEYLNYTIRAYAHPVPGETDTADNIFTYGTVRIVHEGDVNNDGQVRIDDILDIALAFGSNCGYPGYYPDRDINCDGQIRIDDVLAAALNFGWP